MSKKILLAILALVLAGIVGFGAYSMYGSNAVSNNDGAVVQEQEQTENQSATESEIEFSQDGETVTYGGRDGETALEVLKSLTTVETEDSDFGEFVVAINGVKADADKEFWAFYVNGEQAKEGAGTYESSDEDELQWRLEESL